MKIHLRNEDFWICWNYKLNPKTFCHIRSESNEIVGMAEITRHPKDKHVKETARKESLARAMKNAGFSKEERESIWLQYFSRADAYHEQQWNDFVSNLKLKEKKTNT